MDEMDERIETEQNNKKKTLMGEDGSGGRVSQGHSIPAASNYFIKLNIVYWHTHIYLCLFYNAGV